MSRFVPRNGRLAALACAGLLAACGTDGQAPPAMTASPFLPMDASIEASPPASWLAFCARDPDRALCTTPSSTGPLTTARWRELEAVQAYFNSRVSQRSDAGLDDVWQLIGAVPEGDCEDIALTKRDALIGLGWPAGSLRMGICYNDGQEVGGRLMHAVLTVETNLGTYVLGNLRPGVEPWNASECKAWVMRADVPDWRWVAGGVRVPIESVAEEPAPVSASTAVSPLEDVVSGMSRAWDFLTGDFSDDAPPAP